jgi:mannose-6-phosphate isomerase-like protein (cupin superfamily)
MESFEMTELSSRQAATSGPYLEFLRSGSLSCGLYVLGPGQEDPQGPHSEDEVYFVISGRGSFVSGGKTIPVVPGKVFFVPAREPHRFADVSEELRLLVFFSPPESEPA